MTGAGEVSREDGDGRAGNDVAAGYSADETDRLQLIWGEGFLSPGGSAEIARMLAGADLRGSDVLDIGSGAGGADIALVTDHRARSVVGIDVQQELIDVATRRAAQVGLIEQISYRLVEPERPLPFPDASFDAVFSKDAIIHVRQKRALYGEMLRVLRPGGRLFVSDWLRGEGDQLTSQVDTFVEVANHGFVMVSLAEMGTTATEAGFAAVELDDRREWYLGEATLELDRLRGLLRRHPHGHPNTPHP